MGTLDLRLRFPKRIDHGDPERFKMADVPGKNRQFMMNRCGGDGDVREAGREAGSMGVAGQPPCRSRYMCPHGQYPAAVKIDDRIQPLGQ
jgi:hypothetical protein